MGFICEECGYKTTTEGGMKLHHKVAHTATSTVKTTPVKKIEPKQAKKKRDILATADAMLKEKQAQYAALKKQWPKKATNIGSEEKISRAKLKKMFPKETTVFVNGRLPAVPLHPKLESSYTITVKQMKNEWIAVSLIGKKTKIAWKEGPFPKNYRVTIPSLQTK